MGEGRGHPITRGEGNTLQRRRQGCGSARQTNLPQITASVGKEGTIIPRRITRQGRRVGSGGKGGVGTGVNGQGGRCGRVVGTRQAVNGDGENWAGRHNTDHPTHKNMGKESGQGRKSMAQAVHGQEGQHTSMVRHNGNGPCLERTGKCMWGWWGM